MHYGYLKEVAIMLGVVKLSKKLHSSLFEKEREVF